MIPRSILFATVVVTVLAASALALDRVVSDDFNDPNNNVTGGISFNGRSTPTGGQTWATTGGVFRHISYANVATNSATTPTVWADHGLDLSVSPTQQVGLLSVQADVTLRNAGWVMMGFTETSGDRMRSHDATTGLISSVDDTLALRFGSNGDVEVFGHDDGVALNSWLITNVKPLLGNPVDLRSLNLNWKMVYDPTARTVNGWLNNTNHVVIDYVLPIGFTPVINRAGYQVEVNGGGQVGGASVLTDNYSATVQINEVPEPATALLLAVGGLLLRRKR